VTSEAVNGTTGHSFDVLVLAAGRGADDPMAGVFEIPHKCLVPVLGQPMILRVLRALRESRSTGRVVVSTDQPDALNAAPGVGEFLASNGITTIESRDRAGSSVTDALAAGVLRYPVLVTTADHALLTAQIVDDFCRRSLEVGGDITAGLATETLLSAAYPDTRRTYLEFAGGRYTGCNLFGFLTPNAARAAEFWARLDRERKRPWRLVRAFGAMPLLLYALRRLTLRKAFEIGSRRLGLSATPILLPFAEAAIDVDKPADLALAERILASREANAG